MSEITPFELGYDVKKLTLGELAIFNALAKKIEQVKQEAFEDGLRTQAQFVINHPSGNLSVILALLEEDL